MLKKIILAFLILCFGSFIYSAYSSDVVLGLEFEPSHTLDNSGNNLTITLTNNNSAVFSSSVYKYGIGSFGAQTDRGSQSVDIGNITDTIQTVSFWMYVPSTSGTGAEGYWSNNNGVIEFYGYNLGTTYASFLYLNGPQMTFPQASTDTWHYWQFDFSATDTKAYLDGSLVRNISGSVPLGNTHEIGNLYGYTYFGFGGYIDRFLLSKNLYNGTEIPTVGAATPTFTWTLTPTLTYTPTLTATPTLTFTITPTPSPIPSFLPTPPVSNGLLKGYLVTTVYGSLHVWVGDAEFISWYLLYGESLIIPIPGVTIVPLY